MLLVGTTDSRQPYFFWFCFLVTYTDKFLAGFDSLAELAKGCDTDNIILATLITSANGYLNVKMRDLDPGLKLEQTVGTDPLEYTDRITDTRVESS